MNAEKLREAFGRASEAILVNLERGIKPGLPFRLRHPEKAGERLLFAGMQVAEDLNLYEKLDIATWEKGFFSLRLAFHIRESTWNTPIEENYEINNLVGDRPMFEPTFMRTMDHAARYTALVLADYLKSTNKFETFKRNFSRFITENKGEFPILDNLSEEEKKKFDFSLYQKEIKERRVIPPYVLLEPIY